MDQWIQVFRTGKHVDASGQEKEWRKEDLDRIVYSYNPQGHEAPVVIGHPKENAPAYGWVGALKREGEILYAKLENLVPDFVDMLKRGLFKKRSVSLYPDLTLRHVGFLGAKPPAISGLEDIKFQGRDQTTISFSDFEDNLNFEEGGAEEMNKQAQAKNDMERELQRRVNEVLRNPPGFDKRGNKFSERPTYSEALSYVWEDNPELAQRYAESVRPRRGRPQYFNEAAGKKITELVDAKMRGDKTLCYSEALVKVQLENPDLIREYLVPDSVGNISFRQAAEIVLNYMGGSQGLDLSLIAGKIKMAAELAQDLLARDPTLTKIDAIIRVLKDDPSLARDLTARGKTFGL